MREMSDVAKTEAGEQGVVGMMQQATLAEAKSPVGVFELPCGYLDAEGVLHRQVEVREITGFEEDMLASKNVSSHQKISNLISSCTVRIGTITDKGKLALITEELLVGDRVFLMFAIRRVSVGDEYPFRSRCPAKECKYSGIFYLSLADLETKPMPDPTKRIFDTTLPTGKQARFRPLKGRDEETLSKAASKNDALSLAMLLRLEMLKGEPPTLQAVKSLSMRDRTALRVAFDEVEGGVETTLDMKCPVCGLEFEEELDVGQAGFFFPSQVAKDSKTRSST